MRFEARKVVAARPDINPSAADFLDEPIIVCKASGICVIPKELQRNRNVITTIHDTWHSVSDYLDLS
jgi:hypothetical protein